MSRTSSDAGGDPEHRAHLRPDDASFLSRVRSLAGRHPRPAFSALRHLPQTFLGVVGPELVPVQKEASPEQVKKVLTGALLLTGLRVRRDVAVRIFRGVRAMQETDTYLM